jgi:hypothetical protein
VVNEALDGALQEAEELLVACFRSISLGSLARTLTTGASDFQISGRFERAGHQRSHLG